MTRREPVPEIFERDTRARVASFCRGGGYPAVRGHSPRRAQGCRRSSRSPRPGSPCARSRVHSRGRRRRLPPRLGAVFRAALFRAAPGGLLRGVSPRTAATAAGERSGLPGVRRGAAPRTLAFRVATPEGGTFVRK